MPKYTQQSGVQGQDRGPQVVLESEHKLKGYLESSIRGLDQNSSLSVMQQIEKVYPQILEHKSRELKMSHQLIRQR